MKFLLKHKAYINLPMHMQDDPPGFIRMVPQLVMAEPTNPREITLPDDISLDNISRTWEPLDEKAREAIAKLNAGRKVAEPAKPTAEAIVEALLAMPADQRSALLAAAAEKERKAKAEAAGDGTMSGALAKQAAAQKPKG